MFKVISIMEVVLMMVMNVTFIGAVANFVMQRQIKHELNKATKNIKEEIESVEEEVDSLNR
jgi:hypothetical protein